MRVNHLISETHIQRNTLLNNATDVFDDLLPAIFGIDRIGYVLPAERQFLVPVNLLFEICHREVVGVSNDRKFWDVFESLGGISLFIVILVIGHSMNFLRRLKGADKRAAIDCQLV